MLAFHGTNDSGLNVENARALCPRAEQVGVAGAVVEDDGMGHGEPSLRAR